MNHVITPPTPAAVPVAGGGLFPVHRIYCVGRNYAEHAQEMGFSGREPPFFFLKPADAVVPVAEGTVGEVTYPPLTANLHHEIELVVAIGVGGRNIAAADAVKEGVSAGAVDRAARKVLQASGLGPAFVHATGHGLGLEIHEKPRLARGEKTLLRAGMVITIEPGVYLQKFGGIRIEDTVAVTRNGCEILTPTSKELLTI